MAASKKGKTALIVGSIIFSILIVVLALSLIFGTKGYFAPNFYERDSISFEEDAYTSPKVLESDNYYEGNTDSKIKKSGDIDLKVENLEEAYDSVRDIMKGYQATVVSSSDSGEGNEKIITTTIKVKSESFEDIYEDVKLVDGEVLYASYYTDDITMEYTDLESRLRNLEATEVQLAKILDSADTVEDTLSVYVELTNIRSQIEVIKGQLKYLDSQVDYSYLTINLSLSDLGRQINDEEWKPLGIAKNALSSLVKFGVSLVNILIWVLVFSPVIAIIVVIVVLVKRKAKKSKEMV